MTSAIIIFAITYCIITGRRLRLVKIGRPAGVTLGTVLMVAAGVMTPAQVYAGVNWDTILLLLGMMIVIEHLSEFGFFALLAEAINRRQCSPRRLLAYVVFGTGILAAFLVNDIVCLLFTPLLMIMVVARRLPPLPFIIGIATSTNIGGVMAFTGTPQNMIIGNLSGISYTRYFLLMFPIGLVCLLINFLVLLWLYRADFAATAAAPEPPAAGPRAPAAGCAGLKRSVAVTCLVIAGFFIFPHISWVAMAGAAFLLLCANRDEASLLRRLDWNLLLFFAGLFAVVHGLQVAGVVDAAMRPLEAYFTSDCRGAWLFGGATVIGSNLFANVPYVLVTATSIERIANPDLLWLTLAFASTIAGNLTIIGAVANIIVIERAKSVHDVSFMDFFRFGVPSTLGCFAAGMLMLCGYRLLGWL